MPIIKRVTFSFILFYSIIFSSHLYAKELLKIKHDEFLIYYHPSLSTMASETAGLYLDLKSRLEKTFSWRLDSRASIVLIKDRKNFVNIAESPLTVAFAVPSKNLIVIDCSSVTAHPLSLELTLMVMQAPCLLWPRWFRSCPWRRRATGAADGYAEW